MVTFIPQRVFYRGKHPHFPLNTIIFGRAKEPGWRLWRRENFITVMSEIELRCLGCPAHYPNDIMLSYLGSGWKNRASYGWKWGSNTVRHKQMLVRSSVEWNYVNRATVATLYNQERHSALFTDWIQKISKVEFAFFVSGCQSSNLVLNTYRLSSKECTGREMCCGQILPGTHFL